MNSNSFSKYVKLTWLIIWLPFVLIFILVSLISLEVFFDLPSVEELQNPKSNLATVVYSSDMKILGKYYTENRINVKYYELDEDLVNALIATEDARFNDHSGIDLKALGRSASGVLTGNSNKGGGSTLTQQLAKNLFPRGKVNGIQLIFRKFKEWIIAVKFERNFTKHEIISSYFNNAILLANSWASLSILIN
jgi:penicillin-binding protein 1A